MTEKKTIIEPIEDMKIILDDNNIIIKYSGYDNGLLIHQSHLADKIINSVLKDNL
jgi:hypothetical protein